MRMVSKARRIALCGAVSIGVIAIGLWAGGPAVLARVHPAQVAPLPVVAPASVAAAELGVTSDLAAALDAAPSTFRLNSAAPSLAEARARWLAAGGAARGPEPSDGWARHPEP